ncbi:MAG: DUF1549 and DUF1553 domain-containing protein [Planctomycetota bacterium]
MNARTSLRRAIVLTAAIATAEFAATPAAAQPEENSPATPQAAEAEPARAEPAAAEASAADAATPDAAAVETAAPTATAPEEPRFVSLAVYPPRLALSHAGDARRVIAVATRSDGVTRDVTADATWQLESTEGGADAFSLDAGRLRASRDGRAGVRAAFAGLSAQAEATAAGVDAYRGVSYRHDVIPIFLRAGCNSGGCHGSSRGKDGFRLSLFGFDPASDHHRLTRELVGRRLNYSLPEESLLLTKATASAPHTGGKRLERGDDAYNRLREWIEAGAPNDLAGATAVESVRLYPPAAAMESGGQAQRFVVVATYSDGSTRDVTDLSVFLSSNEASAAIDQHGVARTGLRGEAFVMARFDTHTVGSQVLSLPAAGAYTPTEDASDVAPGGGASGYIDRLVSKKLRTMRITPSGLCTDEQFLRRVTIDIAGELPTPAERRAFLADPAPDKRARKIDELLARPGFASIWAKKWADLLLVRTQNNRVDYKPMHLYATWLRQQVQSGRPLDEMIRDLLSATGSTFDTPQTNFYQIEPDAKKTAENVAQSLLGLRLQCAQCHNHPFDRWTMDDYYAFTSFFTQIGRKRADDYREWYVFNRGGGEARHPVGNRVMKPKFLGGEEPDTAGRDRRAVVAEWITSADNPYFAPSVANRVWAHFFGVGVVEPVDDIRISNPPSNPELFDTLGRQLVEYGYDLRQLVRDICNSRAYQRSPEPNATNRDDARNFARMAPRRLPAATLLDCLGQATGAPEKLPGLPRGAKATEIADGRAGNFFLSTFGKPSRETVCACESDASPTLSQALHLINGGMTNDAIARGGLVRKWLGEGKTPAEVIDAIYARCLTRSPTPQEHADYAALIGDDQDTAHALEDIFWAVLNSREFYFNH